MNAALFDFGGTIDTNGIHWSEKYCQLYRQFDVQRSKHDIEQAFVESERNMAGDKTLRTATMHETLKKQLGLQFSLLYLKGEDVLLKSMLEHCYKDVRQTIAKAKIILHKLQKKYTLGVVSNFYGNLEVVLKEFELDKVFATAIDSEVVGARKPDPHIFMFALNNLHALPRETYVVGDSYERDILPSKQIGCTTIWLEGKSWSTPPSTTAADYTINSLEGVVDILM